MESKEYLKSPKIGLLSIDFLYRYVTLIKQTSSSTININTMKEKEMRKLFCDYFGIKHFTDLIGRKFLIYYFNQEEYDHSAGDEICFPVQQYYWGDYNLTFIVPTIGIEGNSAIKNVTLTFFPSDDNLSVKYGLSYESDYLLSNIASEKLKYISVVGGKFSRVLRVKLI